MLQRIAITVAVVGVLGAVGAFGAFAIFTDTAAVPDNDFTAGTVDISTAPASAFITLGALAPGRKITQPLTVSNDGSLELRYAVTSLATNADGKGLRSQLDLTVKSGVTDCSNAGFDADGTVLYGPGDVGTDPASNLIGDPTQGAQAGDRTLAASASEVLCFQAALPLATGNAFQAATTSATLNFVAEQTENNP